VTPLAADALELVRHSLAPAVLVGVGPQPEPIGLLGRDSCMTVS
jgi:hypothetical protein